MMKKRKSLSTMELLKHVDYSGQQVVKVEGNTLLKLQRVLLSIAEDIIRTCEEENIYYQLSGGSALGAVRHGGFIPWDDDFDINMLGDEQEKFVKTFEKKYSGKYTVQTYLTPNYGLQMAKVRLNGSVARSHLDPEDENSGISIDIFFLENVPDNVVVRKIHGYMCLGFGLILSCRNYYKNRKLLLEITRNDKEVQNVIKKKINIGRLVSFISVRRLAIMTHTVYSMYKNNNSKYISIPGGRKHYFGELYSREGMQNTVPMKFENHSWNVANNYDEYFTALYGTTYMTPPPPDKREEHVYLELKFPQKG